MKDKQLIKRTAIYLLGIFTLAMGVAFSINSNLGTTPVSVIPYVLSTVLGVQIGMLSIAIQFTFIFIQMAILRKDFKLISLTQFIFTFIFGYFIDFTLWLLDGFMIPGYLGQVLMSIMGIILLATGIVIFMEAKFVNLPPEELCKVIADKYIGGKFHIARMYFDITLVVVGVVLSFAVLGEVVGVREGTVLTAIATGRIMPFIRRRLVRLR